MTGPATRIHQFLVRQGGMRLDHFLAGQLPEMTRSQLHRLIADGLAAVNGQTGRPAQKVRQGDQVSLSVPPPVPVEIMPQEMPLSIRYQDEAIIVIDKPAGLSVHPGPGHPDHTLVNALLAHCPDIQGVGGEIRPGIVHRLDKDTSGLMVAAKTHQAHLSLSEQIKRRQVTKGYLALAAGKVEPPAGQIEAPIGRHPYHRQRMAVVPDGREARTSYRALEYVNGYTLLELCLETGRTHQIRVHLAHLGHPLLGDAVYGKAGPLVERHFLHASQLGFRHPTTGEWLEFWSDLQADLAAALRLLRAAPAHS